jgi:hypothetical protein
MNYSFLQTMRALQFAYLETQSSQLRNKRLVVVVVVVLLLFADTFQQMRFPVFIIRAIYSNTSKKKVCIAFSISFKSVLLKIKIFQALSHQTNIYFYRSQLLRIATLHRCLWFFNPQIFIN